MKLPTIQGMIRRRILLNYVADPTVVESLLPEGFRPKTYEGHAVAGICMIRLEEVRPMGLPRWMGIASENAAHRIAVEWERDGKIQEGVYVPQRHTDSRLNTLAGGRLFPGVQKFAQFKADISRDAISMEVWKTKRSLIAFELNESDSLSANSIFPTLEESSRFFQTGSIGYSPRLNSPILDGMRLEIPTWKVSSLSAKQVRSSFFDDRSIFPEGTIRFDHALLMRELQHSWHTEPAMRIPSPSSL